MSRRNHRPQTEVRHLHCLVFAVSGEADIVNHNLTSYSSAKATLGSVTNSGAIQ